MPRTFRNSLIGLSLCSTSILKSAELNEISSFSYMCVELISLEVTSFSESLSYPERQNSITLTSWRFSFNDNKVLKKISLLLKGIWTNFFSYVE